MLSIDPSTLSRILSQKKTPSGACTQKFISKLKLSDFQKRKFITSLEQQKTSRTMTRNFLTESPLIDLKAEEFDAIHDLLHFSLVELTFVKDFKYNIPTIAKRLNRSPFDVRRAIERLLSLGLLEKKGDTLVKVCDRIFVNKGLNRVSNVQIKRHLCQVFECLKAAVSNQSSSLRVVTGFTVPTNPQKIAEARVMIEDFSLELIKFLAEGEKTEVYQLGIGLIPLTQ